MYRHRDTRPFQTFLLARAPRMNCAVQGVVHTEIPGAEPRGGNRADIAAAFPIRWVPQNQTTPAEPVDCCGWVRTWPYCETNC